jgi:hypothetical protein
MDSSEINSQFEYFLTVREVNAEVQIQAPLFCLQTLFVGEHNGTLGVTTSSSMHIDENRLNSAIFTAKK